MSTRDQSLLDRLSNDMESHARNVTDRAGQEIFGDDGGGDATHLSRQKYLDYLRRNWSDGPDGGQQFRQELLQRVGEEEFLKQAFAVFFPEESEAPFLRAVRGGTAAMFQYPNGGDDGM